MVAGAPSPQGTQEGLSDEKDAFPGPFGPESLNFTRVTSKIDEESFTLAQDHQTPT